jgi:hypothetical protein
LVNVIFNGQFWIDTTTWKIQWEFRPHLIHVHSHFCILSAVRSILTHSHLTYKLSFYTTLDRGLFLALLTGGVRLQMETCVSSYLHSVFAVKTKKNKYQNILKINKPIMANARKLVFIISLNSMNRTLSMYGFSYTFLASNYFCVLCFWNSFCWN